MTVPCNTKKILVFDIDCFVLVGEEDLFESILRDVGVIAPIMLVVGEDLCLRSSWHIVEQSFVRSVTDKSARLQFLLDGFTNRLLLFRRIVVPKRLAFVPVEVRYSTAVLH